MTKVVILLILLLQFGVVLGQRKVSKTAVNMNSCEGAVNIFENGEFNLQFTGSSDNSVEAYPSLSSIDGNNALWVSYIAPSSGEISFTASTEEGYLQMVVFQEVGGDICGELDVASAEIQRVMLSKNNTTVGLRHDIDSSFLYSLHQEAGKKVYVMFSTNEKSKSKMTLDWTFNPDEVVVSETKIVDKRDDDFAPTLSFTVRDKESGDPLVAALLIEGQKDIQGLYTGSDFYFNIDRRVDLTIQCDLEGYFFHDSIYEVNGMEDVVICIVMDKVASGKSIQIEEIEFKPGTSEILTSSEPKLRRLKDFLLLNADLHIEIQGHVMAVGDNSFLAQKVSEARAKRVMKYLVDNGVSKKRLTTVGYGNTRPIFENPTLTHQEQANRRVEIVVL